MPLPNLKKDYGWGTIFYKTGGVPSLPEQLTSKWWSKQKQLLAAGKETGMGSALDELQKLFKSVRFTSVMGRQDTVERDTELAEECMKAAPLKAFVKQVGEVKKIAKKHAGDFKGSTKKTGDALVEIGDVCEAVEEVCDEDHLKDCLKNALSEAADKKFQVIVENAALVVKARDEVLKKIPAGLEEINKALGRFSLDRKQESAVKLGNTIMSYCRDMTQVLFNMLKLDEGGFTLDEFDPKKGKKVNDVLVNWADVKDAITYDNPQAAIADVKKLAEATKAYILVVKPVKLPKKK
jgi:hypothetical protein